MATSRRRAGLSFGADTLAIALVVALPRLVGAVDMTGDWYTAGPTGPAMPVHFTQTGTALQTNVGASGTIDSASGAFTLVFPIVNGSDCGGVLHGQVAPDGDTFVAPGTASFTPPGCQSVACACSSTRPTELVGSRSPCGNGVLDAGEQCDDGELGRGNSCCQLGCTLKPDGTSCDDGLFCNGQESTCAAGVCQHGASPCPFNCDEGSDTCLAACPSTPQSCRAAARSRLVLKRGGDGSHDRLIWNWSRGAATSMQDFADPLGVTTYALCIYDGASPAPVDRLIVPAGSDRWRPIGTVGYKYTDSSGAAQGVQKITLKGSAESKSKVQVAGKGSALPDVALPLTAPVTVQLLNGTNGLCWGSSYDAAQLRHNDGSTLTAKTP